MLIPVYTGTAPVSERVVGIVFVGDGDVCLYVFRSADAWTFANHMVRWSGKERSDMAPIAAQRVTIRSVLNKDSSYLQIHGWKKLHL